MKFRIAAMLLATFASGPALAQSPNIMVHDDISGTIKDQYVRKADTRYDHNGASLTFDIDYTYKASLLMGEPLTLCSAQIKNPRGSITFEYEGQSHTVSINEENARLLTPYNVDYAIAYKSINSDNIYYMSRCNTGVPGSWAEDGFNVAGSPDWDDFLCWTGGSRPGLPDPMPDSLGENWCKTIGNAESRILDEAKAKEWFTRSGFSSGGTEPVMRAMSVHVASFAVDYNELVLAEIKKISSQKIAQRKFDQAAQIGGSLRKSSSRVGAQAAERLDAAIGEAKSQGDPREQARTLQEAMRDVLAIQPAADEAPAFAEIRTFIISLLSSDDERSFIAGIKQDLSELQAEAEQSTQAVAGIFDSHRAAGANAPAFAFADAEATPAVATGPADIKQEIQRIDAHDGWAVRRVVFHPDGKRLLSSGWDKTVRFWDLASGTELWRESGYNSSAITFTPDGRSALITDDDGGVNVIDVETGSRTRHLSEDSRRIYSMAISPNGRYLFTGAIARAYLWDLERGTVIRTLDEGASQQHLGAFTSNSEIIIHGGQNRNLLWKGIENKFYHQLNDIDDIRQISLDGYKGYDNEFLNENNNLIIIHNRYIRFVSGKDAQRKYKIRQYSDIYTSGDGSIISFAATDDGKFIIHGESDGNVVLTNRHTREQRDIIGRHDSFRKSGFDEFYEQKMPNIVFSVAFNKDGSLAASAGIDGTIRIWGPAQ